MNAPVQKNDLYNPFFLFLRFRFIMISLLLVQFPALDTSGQMRQVFVDLNQADNHINKISFYNPSQGYVAFTKWIGYTIDSGRTFTRKYITMGNVDYNGYNVNLTFGFGIAGVKAFGSDTIIAYGDYGAVPSILYSTDQGNTFKLIYQSQLNPQRLSGITDMVFPENTNIGFAVEADRIIKTLDRGKTWFPVYAGANSFFDFIEAVNDNTIFAFSTQNANKLLKSTNGGGSWQQLTIPSGSLNYVHFISANNGWLNTRDGNVYYTSNGGVTWQLKNNNVIAPFYCTKMKFVNESTGYATGDLYTVYKTSDSGRIWEPLPRDNNYTYLGYGHTDLYFLNNSQFWAGGGHGFLELTTNAGGTPIPKALFRIDTTNVSATNVVNVVNYSKTDYQFRWYKNDTLFSTAYNASYVHDIYRKTDTIKLVVLNGSNTDTAVLVQYFNVPPAITSFTPTTAASGTSITITGENFTGATAVSFGGVAAASFSVTNDQTIIAVVGNGASGQVSVATPYGAASAPGFSYIPIPTISSFSPTRGGAGTTIAINGTNFSGTTAVSFGGVAARSFTVVSETQINAVVDGGATGAIAVTNPFGTATKDGFVFMPAPVITSFAPATATTGDRITITGTNLGNVNSVQFGGVSATSFYIQSATTIYAYVGAGATGSISVLSPYGNSSIPGFMFKPLPVIISFSPATGPVGTTVTITGEHFTNTQKVYFGGVEAASFAVVSDNTISAVTGVGVDGQITVVNDAGSGYSSGQFIFQYPAPEITSFTPGAGAEGAQITITGKNFLPGLTSVTFGYIPAKNVVVKSSTSITATVGTGSSGDIYVSTPGGETSLPGFTFIPPPPSISEFRPLRATEGMAVGISGISFTGTTAVTFGGVPATSFTVFSDTYIMAIVGAGASGAVAVTTPYGTGSKPGFIFGGVVIDSISPAAGAPGTVVTITGSGFVNVSYVYFGNASVTSFKVNSPTSITATVPQGGSGLVTIITQDGNLAFSNGFTYQSPATLITSVAPNVASAGTTVTIRGSGFSQASAVSFGGVPAASYTVNSPYAITATVAGGSSGNVAVTSPLGTATYGGFSYTGAPIITGFSPEAASSGTTITISGANFNPSPTSNIVYFGGLKAEVITASEKSLTVKVPAGAPYSYISVTNNSLTGYSQRKFNTTFTATGPLSANSFEVKIDSVWGTSPVDIDAADFDLDGKPDIAVCHASFYLNADHIAIFKNNSTKGKLSLLPKELINSEHVPMSAVTADFDGDGKLDLVVANALDGHEHSVYRNASAGSTISFENEILLMRAGVDENSVTCTDVDADGKPDIIITSIYSRVAIVHRNTSTIGHLSFVQVPVAVPYYSYDIKVADMDLDGKPDLVMLGSAGYYPGSGSIFRNASTPGNIVFEAVQPFQTGPDPRHLDVGDMDGDGKMDIIVPGGNNYVTVSVVRNLSIPGKIVMDDRKNLLTTSSPAAVAIADMNGDGKPDVLTSFGTESALAIYPNTSIPGNFSCGAAIQLNTTGPVNAICVSDLDSDQRPDIIVSNTEAGSISFFRNNLSALLLTSFSPARGSTGTVVTIKGENLTNATAVTIGGEPVTSFTVVDANTIKAVVGAGKSGDVSVTTPLGTVKLSGFVYIGAPTITSFTPTTAGTGTAVVIKGADFTGATSVSFGGVAARSFTVNSDSSITAVVGLGASGVVAVTTQLGTGTHDGFTYDPLTAIVDPGNANSAALTVKPNPAHDVLIINHPASAKTAILRFIDVTGRTVKMVEPARTATQTATSVHGLSPGMYTIVWSDGIRTLSRVIVVQ